MTCRSPSASACHSAGWSEASRARRREDPFRAFGARLVEIVPGHEQVLRAGLGEHLQALSARLADHLGALGGRDVEDHDRLVDQRRAGDQPVERFRLAVARVRDGVEFRRRVAVLEQPLAHPGDHAVVLGMHAHHGAVVARRLQHVEQLLVVDLQPVVGHEHFQRGVAGLDQRRHLLLQHLLARVGQDHVERVVDHGAAFGERVILVHHGLQAHADVLRGERDDGGGAAERRCRGGGLEGVGVDQAGRRELLDVAVAVDAAREDEFSARVDLALALVETLGDRRHRRAADADIGLHGVGRGRDCAAADHEVEGLHCSLHSMETGAAVLYGVARRATAATVENSCRASTWSIRIRTRT